MRRWNCSSVYREMFNGVQHLIELENMLKDWFWRLFSFFLPAVLFTCTVPVSRSIYTVGPRKFQAVDKILDWSQSSMLTQSYGCDVTGLTYTFFDTYFTWLYILCSFFGVPVKILLYLIGDVLTLWYMLKILLPILFVALFLSERQDGKVIFFHRSLLRSSSMAAAPLLEGGGEGQDCYYLTADGRILR